MRTMQKLKSCIIDRICIIGIIDVICILNDLKSPRKDSEKRRNCECVFMIYWDSHKIIKENYQINMLIIPVLFRIEYQKDRNSEFCDLKKQPKNVLTAKTWNHQAIKITPQITQNQSLKLIHVIL